MAAAADSAAGAHHVEGLPEVGEVMAIPTECMAVAMAGMTPMVMAATVVVPMAATVEPQAVR